MDILAPNFRLRNILEASLSNLMTNRQWAIRPTRSLIQAPTSKDLRVDIGHRVEHRADLATPANHHMAVHLMARPMVVRQTNILRVYNKPSGSFEGLWYKVRKQAYFLGTRLFLGIALVFDTFKMIF
jgi:hypothetical protein